MAENEIIYGKRAVIEALRSGVPVRRVCIADNIVRDSMVSDILRKAEHAGVGVDLVPRKRIEELSGAGFSSSQGVVAEAKPFRYASLADVIAAANVASGLGGGAAGSSQGALVVLCDHITDAGNLGAIARSAESVGASGIIIPNKRSAQVTPATYKTSAGAVAHLPIAQVPNLKRALDELKDAGFWVVGATEHAHDALWDTDMAGRIVLVVGNEHEGISDLVLKNCDFACKLPQRGEISSLNVAQASTVFMYEWLRQNQALACG